MQDADAGVVDLADTGKLGRLFADDLDGLLGRLRLRAIFNASSTIAITRTAAMAITTTPTAIPNTQPVDDAVSIGTCHRGVGDPRGRSRVLSPGVSFLDEPVEPCGKSAS